MMAIPMNQPDGFRPGPGHGAADSFADAAGAGEFPSENDLERVDKLHINQWIGLGLSENRVYSQL